MEKEERFTFKDRLENIWYHYKWLIILGSAVALLIIQSVVSMILKVEGDVAVMYVGPATVTVQGMYELRETLQSLIDDYNGDGKIKAEYLEITVSSDRMLLPADSDVSETSDMSETELYINIDDGTALRRMNYEVLAGASIIYFVDEYYYDRLIEGAMLAKFSDILDAGELPDKMNDDYSVYLRDLRLYDAPGFRDMPDTTILCIRYSPELDSIKYGRTPEYYAAHVDCLKKLLAYG